MYVIDATSTPQRNAACACLHVHNLGADPCMMWVGAWCPHTMCYLHMLMHKTTVYLWDSVAPLKMPTFDFSAKTFPMLFLPSHDSIRKHIDIVQESSRWSSSRAVSLRNSPFWISFGDRMRWITNLWICKREAESGPVSVRAYAAQQSSQYSGTCQQRPMLSYWFENGTQWCWSKWRCSVQRPRAPNRKWISTKGWNSFQSCKYAWPHLWTNIWQRTCHQAAVATREQAAGGTIVFVCRLMPSWISRFLSKPNAKSSQYCYNYGVLHTRSPSNSFGFACAQHTPSVVPFGLAATSCFQAVTTDHANMYRILLIFIIFNTLMHSRWSLFHSSIKCILDGDWQHIMNAFVNENIPT